MAKYKVVKPTTVMPEATGFPYVEGDIFEIDERSDFNKAWVAEQLKEKVIEPVKEKKETKPKEPKKEKGE
jgi:hypothetical protein